MENWKPQLINTLLVLFLIHCSLLSSVKGEELHDCIVHTTRPLTIRLNIPITTEVPGNLSVSCTDDHSTTTPDSIPILSQDLLATDSILSIIVTPVPLPDYKFTCTVTSGGNSKEEIITTASCISLKDVSSYSLENVKAKRISSTSVTIRWDRLGMDAFSVSHYEAIVQAYDGDDTLLRAYTKGDGTDEVTVHGQMDEVEHNVKVNPVGLTSGKKSVNSPAPGSITNVVSIPTHCLPASGHVVHVTLLPTVIEDAEDVITTNDLCSAVDDEKGFVREALDLLFIEQESIPEECREVPAKILSYKCGKKIEEYEDDKRTKKTRKSKNEKRKGRRPGSRKNGTTNDTDCESSSSCTIQIKALVLCDACQQGSVSSISSEEKITGRRKQRKKGSKKGSRSRDKSRYTHQDIVNVDLLPEQLIVKRLAFEVKVRQIHKRRHRSSKLYCGYRKFKPEIDRVCECPTECRSPHFTSKI